MATKTSLLGLTKPAYTDAADIAVLNGNFDLIDKAVGQGARVGNLLDNSYFPSAYVINQRGKTQYTGNVYTIDRWRTYSSTAVINIGAAGINPQVSALLQYLDIDPGRTYTAAICYADGTVSVQTGTFTTGFGSTSSGINCSVSNGYCRFLIRESAAYIRWAALYEGAYTADTLPAYAYKGYAAELAECMRYYQKRDYVITVSQAANDTVVSGFDFMIPMRDAPTVTIHDGEGTANAMSIWTNAGMTNGVAVSQIARVTKWGVGYMTIETPPASYGRVLYLYEASADL